VDVVARRGAGGGIRGQFRERSAEPLRGRARAHSDATTTRRRGAPPRVDV